ncbi:MAG TPA: helix-turn-helix transcriptional regulator [Myxococcota bacterium]|nr:helix-turn-helix transcriptional regulator [Myxococcota bacterium]
MRAGPGSGGRGAELSEGDPVGAERIGAYLARQRQLRGISPEELAQQMRIPLRSLQRLEAGAFDQDPDGFARGFVRTVAIALGLPPDETIARMLPEAGAGDEGAAAGALAQLARAVGLAVVLGALGASSWMWLASGASQTLTPTFRAREDGLVVRRDAVRALAEEHGLLATGSEDAGTLAPLPPAVPDALSPTAPDAASDAASGR